MNQILTGQFIKQCRKEKGLTQELQYLKYQRLFVFGPLGNGGN